MKKHFTIISYTIVVIAFVSLLTGFNLLQPNNQAKTDSFNGNWDKIPDRTWAGPQYWANRLQDWQISNGRLECIENNPQKPMRTIHLLTRQLGNKNGNFTISVNMGLIGTSVPVYADTISADSMCGFLIAAGKNLDYRAAALTHHSPGDDGGIIAAINSEGKTLFRDMTTEGYPILSSSQQNPQNLPASVILTLAASQKGKNYTLTLSAKDAQTNSLVSQATLDNVPSEKLVGNIALLSHPGTGKNTACFWFNNWEVSGSKIIANDNQTCGPIICAQHTISKNILKLSAQIMPIGTGDIQLASLQIKKDNQWTTIACEKIITPSFTATFRIPDWNAKKDTPYRVVYDLKQTNDIAQKYYWYGTIRHDPIEKKTIKLIDLSCNHNMRHPGVEGKTCKWSTENIWFPHNDVVKHVKAHKPDILFFAGDQVYENSSPTSRVWTPKDKAELDYLYKWYVWCWAFADLARDIPCICIPDDHDVFHGNVWGCGGKATVGKELVEIQDSGGYFMHPGFVNMVQQTQTSHLPAPYDPTPVLQGIGVYYTSLNYGQISFAIVEDRKFKSAPKPLLPEGEVYNGWFQNPDFDPATQSDVIGAELLGDRQLKFLSNWTADWSDNTKFKAVLSQTLFATVATLPQTAKNDKVVPDLKIAEKSEYPMTDKLAADMDSDGWPQTGRNLAIAEMRKGFAIHACGDQHIGSTVQYGIDDWRDSCFAICSPAIGNYFPRRWYPPTPGLNRKPDAPINTGDFKDGFGNKVTVYAIANPKKTTRHPVDLHGKAVGYAVIKFDKKDRTITFECWPRYENPADPMAKPYPGWPVTCRQEDNYGAKPFGYLPTIIVNGMQEPVVQVVNESNNDIVYTLRIKGNSYRPKVFQDSKYTINIGELGTEKTKTIKGLTPTQEKTKPITISF